MKRAAQRHRDQQSVGPQIAGATPILKFDCRLPHGSSFPQRFSVLNVDLWRRAVSATGRTKRWGRGCSTECGGLGGPDASPRQGEGRVFESRRPLSVKHLLSTPFDGCLEGCSLLAVPMVCPWSPYGWAMTGSLRQRGPDTRELRVYLGVDHDSGRERWATKTVHGSRRHATARLGEFVEDAGYAPTRRNSG